MIANYAKQVEYLNSYQVRGLLDASIDCEDDVVKDVRDWLTCYYPETESMPLDWAIGEARRLCNNDKAFWAGISHAQDYDALDEHMTEAVLTRDAVRREVKAILGYMPQGYMPQGVARA